MTATCNPEAKSLEKPAVGLTDIAHACIIVLSVLFASCHACFVTSIANVCNHYTHCRNRTDCQEKIFCHIFTF